MLMLLDYYRKVEYPTPKMEQKLYSLYRSRAYCGTTGGAVANCLSRNGLDVQLLHSSENLMDNRDGYFEEDLFRALLREYREQVEACRDQIYLETGTQIDCERLKQFLTSGKQVMLQCIIPGDADGIHQEILHWILLFDYDGTHFVGCDPLAFHPTERMRLTDAEVEHYMDTPIGRICVVVGE